MHHHFYLLMLSALLKGIHTRMKKKASPFSVCVCDNRSVICRLIKTNVLRVIFSHFGYVCVVYLRMGSKINGTKSWKIVIWDLLFFFFLPNLSLLFYSFLKVRLHAYLMNFKFCVICAVAWFLFKESLNECNFLTDEMLWGDEAWD
jgi:hypothetical protein